MNNSCLLIFDAETSVLIASLCVNFAVIFISTINVLIEENFSLIFVMTAQARNCEVSVVQADQCARTMMFEGDRNRYVPRNDKDMDKHCK